MKTDGEGRVVLDGATIVESDIRAGSAIIHVIDAVLAEQRLDPQKTPFEETPPLEETPTP